LNWKDLKVGDHLRMLYVADGSNDEFFVTVEEITHNDIYFKFYGFDHNNDPIGIVEYRLDNEFLFETEFLDVDDIQFRLMF
jgi:hypothetical protein